MLSLISIMCSTGDSKRPPPKPEIMQAMLTPSPDKRKDYIEHNVDYWRIAGSPVFDYDEAWIRKRAAAAFDRSHYPFGKSRQVLAVMAKGNRKEALKSITAPTLVIHGLEYPLVPVEAGIDLTDTIPGARLFTVEGMGHDMPVETWPQIIGTLSEHVKKVTG